MCTGVFLFLLSVDILSKTYDLILVFLPYSLIVTVSLGRDSQKVLSKKLS